MIPPLMKMSTPSTAYKEHSESEWYSRRRSRKGISFCISAFCALSVLGFAFNVFGISKLLLVNESSKLDAIVTVAMCGFHATDMVKAMRTAGEWKGPIYVITDTPDAEDKELCTPVDASDHHPTSLTQEEYETYKEGIHEFNPDIWSKWQKTQIFQLLPQGINTILFIDADMLAQQPIAKTWLPRVAPLIYNQECELSSYPERWYTKIPILGKYDRANAGKIGGGMSIQKRNETSAFLEEWSNLLIRPPFVKRDQGKLTEAVEATNTKVCWLPNRWMHIQNQADLMDRVWFKIVGKGTFLHLASSKKGRWHDMATSECDFSNLPEKAPRPEA